VKTFRHYETTVIVNGALEDDQITQMIDRVSEFLSRNGAQIKSTNHWGRRRLAYPIDKKNNGYYVQYEFEGPGEMVQHLERFFQIEENVIRHLILELDELDLRRRDEMRNRVAAEAEEQAAAEEGAAQERGEKGKES
jgi:small subunit ribosomal protein S6